MSHTQCPVALEKKRLQRRKYCQKCRNTYIQFRILCNLRCRIGSALKGKTKVTRTTILLGCTPDNLIIHLESKFTEGMSWENYGGEMGWQIDHIKPCASFDLSDIEQQKKCFHYSNMQPLWAIDNLKKGSNFS